MGIPVDYVEWLTRQTNERVLHSIRGMKIARVLGIANNRYPNSLRAKRLSDAMREHYRTAPE